MVRSLVTGGAGFIGSHLVDALVERGDAVAAFDDLSTGRRENLAGALERGAILVEGDLRDPEDVSSALAEHAPDRIFHLGAQVNVRRAVADPALDAAVNVLGTINLFEAARRLPGASVVFVSTGGAIYGEGAGRELPFDELAAANPEAAYGASKLAGEVYVRLYRGLYGMPAVAMRLGNVYGPRQDPGGEAGVVSIFADLLRARSPLQIFGDGRQTRDFVYVADVVEALLSADRALQSRGAEIEGPYNVGTGTELEVGELARRLASIAGVELEVEYMPERTGEVRRVAIDPAAARRDLGWEAATGLDDGLRSTYESFGR